MGALSFPGSSDTAEPAEDGAAGVDGTGQGLQAGRDLRVAGAVVVEAVVHQVRHGVQLLVGGLHPLLQLGVQLPERRGLVARVARQRRGELALQVGHGLLGVRRALLEPRDRTRHRLGVAQVALACHEWSPPYFLVERSSPKSPPALAPTNLGTRVPVANGTSAVRAG